MNNDITTGCESIKARQYCSQGDHQGWLVHCAQNMLTPERILSVTTDQWQALIAESNNRFRPEGVSDGSF